MNVLADHEAEVQAEDSEEKPETQQPQDTIPTTLNRIDAQYTKDGKQISKLEIEPNTKKLVIDAITKYMDIAKTALQTNTAADPSPHESGQLVPQPQNHAQLIMS